MGAAGGFPLTPSSGNVTLTGDVTGPAGANTLSKIGGHALDSAGARDALGLGSAATENTTAFLADAAGAVATANLADGAVTPVKMPDTVIRGGPFQGHNAAGACSISGLKVGDKVQVLIDVTSVPADARASFESTITVDNQIQQTSASDLSTHYFLLVVLAKGG